MKLKTNAEVLLWLTVGFLLSILAIKFLHSDKPLLMWVALLAAWLAPMQVIAWMRENKADKDNK
ncbi:hypothetical protein [Azospirillum palustre]